LAHFGYEFSSNPDQLRRSLDQVGLCFLHAPLFHPAMKSVAPIRKELGVKTFFNMLGPMVNPSFPRKQLVGVFSLELARLYGYLYQETEGRFAILHALDGYDEISLTGPFKMITNSGEKLYHPQSLGLDQLSPDSILGGTSIGESARIFEDVLRGKGTAAQNQVVVANSAAALVTAREGLGFEEAIALANETLLTGKALRVFTGLIQPQTSVSFN
jgi:anthranilate phosphoribosyltransferase